jgi:hypothetical protein
LSGRLAKKNGKLWCGKLGEEITTAGRKQAARGVAIELLATLQSAVGDLNKLLRCPILRFGQLGRFLRMELRKALSH